MKRILALLLFVSLPANAAFLEGSDELPLMPGLVEGEHISFDTEESRLFEAALAGDVSKADFTKFYKAALKSLGWTLVGEKPTKLVFSREDETLFISIEGEKPLRADFTLVPKKN